jgi:type IV pilus assembly protein PilA
VMSKIQNRRGGFTLIELMIVVAIIGILAAIAIPNFLKFQLKAKTSEGKTNLAAIRTAEESVFAEYGAYVSADTSPAVGGAVPGNNKAPFVDTGAAGMNFDGLGWTPEGDVYFVYGVAANSTGVAFTASADANIDGDAAFQNWGYRKAVSGAVIPSKSQTAAGVCNFTGIADEEVGPCEPAYGRSVF